MPKSPVRVFWRGADGHECVLRSTDLGWEVAVVDDDGRSLKRELVSGAGRASQVAERWRRDSESSDR